MIKKSAAIMLAAVITGTTAASAAGPLKMILNGYNENGALTYSGMFYEKNGEFDIPDELLGELSGYTLRSYIAGSGKVSDFTVRTASPEGTAIPEATAAPDTTSVSEATSAPFAVPTPEPKNTPSPDAKYPGIYERQIDAVNSIAVVENVSRGENEDSEQCCYADILYQGSRTTVEVKDSVTVSEASDEFSYMLGQNAFAFEKGDAICLTANLRGEINKIGFVYRPFGKNIVTDGNDYGGSFERLISANGSIAGRNGWTVMTRNGGGAKNELAFGVISERKGKSLVLLGADGDEYGAFDLALDDDTIVYVCDMSARRELSINGITAIERSGIPKSAVEDDGFVTYSDGFKTNYALARVVNGTVTEVVIYKNYNK